MSRVNSAMLDPLDAIARMLGSLRANWPIFFCMSRSIRRLFPDQNCGYPETTSARADSKPIFR